MSIVNFIISQVMSDPGVLFGLIALFGLLLLRRPIEEIITGTTKTVIGYLILVAGVGLLQEACNPVSEWTKKILGVDGVIPQNFIIMGKVMAQYGTEVGLVVLIGFILNLVLARITPLKYIAITGHIMVIWASWIVGILAGTHITTTGMVITAGILCGLHYWLTPAAHHYFMKRNDRLTAEWSLYVPDVTGVAVASLLGKIVGNPDKRCDDIKVPKKLEWLRDTTVGIAIVATIFWLILGILAGKQSVEAVSNGKNWILFLIFLGAKFAGGLTVVIYGVRMLLAEIVPAFNGIATKLIPGAIAGLDYPTVYQFAPTAVFIGFIFNLLGGIAATLVMVAFKFPVIVLPAVWMNFWSGALIGTFADAYGGMRATVIICLILGFLVPFGWALAYPLSGVLAGSGAINDYTDVSTYSLIFQYIVKAFVH